MPNEKEIHAVSTEIAMKLMEILVPIRDGIASKTDGTFATSVTMEAVVKMLANMIIFMGRNAGKITVTNPDKYSKMLYEIRTEIWEHGIRAAFDKYKLDYIRTEMDHGDKP